VLGREGYVLKDLGTRNGTWVNGKMIKEAILKDQDLIKVGATTIRFLSKESGIFYDTKDDWMKNPSTMIRQAKGPSIATNDHRKLEILYNISGALSSIFDVKELTEKVAREILKLIDAERFLLMLKDEKTSEITPQIAIGRDGGEVDLEISQTMVKRVVTEGISILVPNVASDPRFQSAQSLILRNIASLLCAPLWSKEGIIGLIYVDTRDSLKSFSEDELELFRTIGNQVALAFQNIRNQERLWQKKRMERELEIAAKIQQSFLPHSFPSCSGYSFGVRSIAAQNVGGDFYDCFKVSEGRIGIVVGDVSGKGVPAALYMARFLSEFKIASLSFPSAGSLLAEMNRRLKEMVMPGSFISAVYLILEIDTGVLNYALAGCHPILLYKRKGNNIVELTSPEGQILGVGDGLFKDETTTIACGDIVVLYTDGVIECKRDFGMDRLKDVIVKSKNFGANEITERIVKCLFEFSKGEEFLDDLTLVVLKRE
jgi:sigma-B regulation protein RsbU (phosphoserine phosphatase)